MSTWKNYQDFIHGCGKWDDTYPAYLTVASNCGGLAGKEKPSVELTLQILAAISRGHAMIRSANNWRIPAIGKHCKSDVEKCRGQQWRFFQVFAGFEVMIKAVFGYEKKGQINWKDELKSKIAASRLFDEAAVPSPMDKKPVPPALKRWKDEPETLNSFLGVSGANKKTLDKWLSKGEELKGSEVLDLAIALRNVTAHGKLSPTKAKYWKICPVFKQLSKLLETKANMVLNRITSMESNTN